MKFYSKETKTNLTSEAYNNRIYGYEKASLNKFISQLNDYEKIHSVEYKIMIFEAAFNENSQFIERYVELSSHESLEEAKNAYDIAAKKQNFCRPYIKRVVTTEVCGMIRESQVDEFVVDLY